MDKENKNEKGMVLVTVIIFGAIIIMLGVALLSTGVMEVKSGNYFERDAQAYFVARSAADMLVKQLEDKKINIHSYPVTFTGNIGDGTYTIQVTKDSNIITLDSTGVSSGVDDTVRVKLIQNTASTVTVPLEYALFASSRIELSEGATINGHWATNSIESDAITLKGGPKINGTVFIGPSGNPSEVIKRYDNIPMPSNGVLLGIKLYPSPQMPAIPTGLSVPTDDFQTNKKGNFTGIKQGVLRADSGFPDYKYEMTGDAQFSKIELPNNGTITINVGNENRTIVVDNFDADNGTINIIGSGRLSIYVKNTMNLRTNYINWDENQNNLKPEKLKFYYYGNGLVDFKSNTHFCGIFQSNLAPMVFTNGTNFYGTIISATSQITLDGGLNAYTNVLYAPNASLMLTDGGNFKGSIIVNSAIVSGAGTVTFNSIGSGNIVTIPVSSGGNATYEKHYE